jgi:hypothetical protein
MDKEQSKFDIKIDKIIKKLGVTDIYKNIQVYE